MNALTLIPMILAIVPGIVQAIEAAASGASGADKKAAALSAVEQAATLAMGVDPNDTALIQLCAKLAGPLIDCIVAVYNLRGLFHKKPAATTVAIGG